MKNTTKQIQSLLNDLEYLDLSFIESIPNSVPLNIENQEVGFKEAIENFIYIKELITDAIDKDTIIFERIVVYVVRNNIITILNKIIEISRQLKVNINNHIVVQQSGVQLISQIISLLHLINSINLEYHLKGTPNYQRKLSEIQYLRKRYKELDKEVKTISKLQNDIKEFHSISSEGKETILKLSKQVDDIASKSVATNSDIEKYYQTIKLNNTSIIEYATKSKQNLESISAFFTEIEGFKKSMTDGLKKIDDALTSNQEIFNEKITQFNIITEENIKNYSNSTNSIIENNVSLQKTIFDILGKAIGTNLYKSFDEKAKSLKFISWVWLGLLTLSLIALTWIGYSVVDDLIKTKTPLEVSFYLRITVLFPIIYAVYFFASLYKNTNKLQEEYDFKSAVSISLYHFKDIIEQTEKSIETQKFLKESISEIFSPPTQRVYGKHKPDKDINDKVETTVEKIITLANTIISKKE